MRKYLQPVFNYASSGTPRIIGWLWAGVLFVLGGIGWAAILNWGDIPFDFHDWSGITVPRMLFLRNAVIELKPPLHMISYHYLHLLTNRFLSLPDIILSPQIFLMRYMAFGRFLMVNVLLQYAAGFAGLVLLRRKFRLSPFAFTVLFLTVNFNGHPIAHITVGHLTWGGYFLFPWFALLIFDLMDGDRSWGWVGKMSLLMFVTFLQGSYHQLVWMLFFMGLLAVSNWKLFIPLLKASIFSVLVNLFRIFPIALSIQGSDFSFIGGYPALRHLWQSLVLISSPLGEVSPGYDINRIGFWELYLYIGFAGAFFLLFFGIFKWFVPDKFRKPAYAGLIFPLAAMTLLSFGKIYEVIQIPWIPILAGERVTARFISLVFIFMVVIAAHNFQKWQDESNPGSLVLIACTALVIILTIDLLNNLQMWQVSNVFTYFPVEIANHESSALANQYDDLPYIQSLIAGGAATLLSFAALSVLMVKERQRRIAGSAALPGTDAIIK